MRWAILTAVLAFGTAGDTAGAEFTSSLAVANRSPVALFATSSSLGANCGSGCTWGKFGPCPACARRTRRAYHGPYYRRPFDYRRSFDFPWSYAPYNPAVYWVSDEASGQVDVAPPLPTP